MNKKGTYIDGFVFTVPKKNVAKYRKMAREGARAWMKFGALDYKECMGNDLATKAAQKRGDKPSNPDCQNFWDYWFLHSSLQFFPFLFPATFFMLYLQHEPKRNFCSLYHARNNGFYSHWFFWCLGL